MTHGTSPPSMMALGHRRAATYSYVFLHYVGALNPDGKPFSDCKKEAARQGIGLIVGSDPGDGDTWEVIVEPKRGNPDPEDLENFLKQLPEDQLDKIRRWSK